MRFKKRHNQWKTKKQIIEFEKQTKTVEKARSSNRSGKTISKSGMEKQE